MNGAFHGRDHDGRAARHANHPVVRSVRIPYALLVADCEIGIAAVVAGAAVDQASLQRPQQHRHVDAFDGREPFDVRVDQVGEAMQVDRPAAAPRAAQAGKARRCRDGEVGLAPTTARDLTERLLVDRREVRERALARNALAADEVVRRDLDPATAGHARFTPNPPERERADVDHRVAAVDREHGTVDVGRVGGEQPGDAPAISSGVLGRRKGTSASTSAYASSASCRGCEGCPSPRRPSACAPSPGRRSSRGRRPARSRARCTGSASRARLSTSSRRGSRRCAQTRHRGDRDHGATAARVGAGSPRERRGALRGRSSRKTPSKRSGRGRGATLAADPGVEHECVEPVEASDRLGDCAVGVGDTHRRRRRSRGRPISLAISSIGPGLRPVTATEYPSAESRRATAAPIPVPPPVTSATRLTRAGPSRSPGRRPCSRR